MEEKKPPERKKKEKPRFVDDGRTVYSMEGLSRSPKREGEEPRLTRKERRAAIRAALGRYMPVVLLTLACFALVGFLLYWWLMY